MSFKNIYKYAKQKKLANFVIYTQAYKEYTIPGKAYTAIPIIEIDTAWSDSVTLTRVVPSGATEVTTREVYTPFYGDIDPRQISVQDDYILLPITVSATTTYVNAAGARAVFCNPSDCVMMVTATVAQLIQNYFNNPIPANDFDIEINDYLGASTAFAADPGEWPQPMFYYYTDDNYYLNNYNRFDSISDVDFVNSLLTEFTYSASSDGIIKEIAGRSVFDYSYEPPDSRLTVSIRMYNTDVNKDFTISFEQFGTATPHDTNEYQTRVRLRKSKYIGFTYGDYVYFNDGIDMYGPGRKSLVINAGTFSNTLPTAHNIIEIELVCTTTAPNSDFVRFVDLTVQAEGDPEIFPIRHYSTGTIKCSQYKWLSDNNFPSQSTPIIASHYYEHRYELDTRGMEYSQYSFTPTQQIINSGGHWADGNNYQSWINYHTFNGLDATLYNSLTYGQNSVSNPELKSKHTTAIQWIIDRQATIDANKIVKAFHDKQMRTAIHASKKLGLGTTLSGNVSRAGTSAAVEIEDEFSDLGIVVNAEFIQTFGSMQNKEDTANYSSVALYNAMVYVRNTAETERARIETELVKSSKAYQKIRNSALVYQETPTGVTAFKDNIDKSFYTELQKLGAVVEALYDDYKEFMINDYGSISSGTGVMGKAKELLDSTTEETMSKLSSGILKIEDTPRVLDEYIAQEEAGALSRAKKYGDAYFSRAGNETVVGVQGETAEGNYVAFRDSYFDRYGEEYRDDLKEFTMDHENFHLQQNLLQPFSLFSYSMNTAGTYHFSEDTSTKWAEDTANISAALQSYMDRYKAADSSLESAGKLAFNSVFALGGNKYAKTYMNSNDVNKYLSMSSELTTSADQMKDFAQEWLALEYATSEDSQYNKLFNNASFNVETTDSISAINMLSFKGTHSVENNSVRTTYKNTARERYNSLNRYKSKKNERGV